MSALVSSEECIPGAGQITLLGQEQAQLERSAGMSEAIRATERIHGGIRLAGSREHLRQPEDTGACTWILGQVWLRRGVSPVGGRLRDRLVGRLAVAIRIRRLGRQTTVAASASVP